MSTVDKLIATFQGSAGAAKGNRYRVFFGDANSEKLNILCDSVSWPGRQIITSEYFTDMKGLKKPYAFVNEDVTVSFILTNDWYAWQYLKKWQSSTINDIDSATGAQTVNLKQSYVKQVVIEHLDSQDRSRKQMVLLNAFPTSLNAMELSNGNENTVLKCSAVFSYDNWTSSDSIDTNTTTTVLPPRANDVRLNNFLL